jgi:5-methylcytosine-specific restriction endonuclease McrA
MTYKRAFRKQSDYGDDWDERSEQIQKLWNYKCSRCQLHKSQLHALGRKLQVHHIRELSHNGTNSARNLKPLCTLCHSKEHSHMTSQRTGRRKLFKAKRYYGL